MKVSKVDAFVIVLEVGDSDRLKSSWTQWTIWCLLTVKYIGLRDEMEGYLK